MPVPSPMLQGSGFPEQNIDQSVNDLIVKNDTTNFEDFKDSLSSNDAFPTVNVNGQSISDLVNQAESLQAQNQYLLDNYPDIAGGGSGSKNYFNVSQAADNLFNNLNSTESFEVKNQPLSLGEGKDFERYASSDDYKAFGYTPGLGLEQEYKYGRSMSWGDTIGRAIGGGSQLAWDTFAEGWKGWGRMASALFTLDSSKLMGSEEERYEMAEEQERIFNKYAIFDTETSKDSLWNRQFFGNMLQQSGFAVGAIAQFAIENYLTAGLGSVIEAGMSSVALARAAKVAETTGELVNNVRKASATILNSEKTVNGFATAAKNLVPFYGTVEELNKLHKAGAGLVQLGMAGLGSTRRALSEFNMARSEAIFEAAGTYKTLKDRLVDEYKQQNGGQVPMGDDLEKINQAAENASHDNFWTNVGILSVMNRIQFDNMYKSFSKTRNIFNESATHLGDDVFKVTGEVGGKQISKAYEKSWFFGELGAVKTIAKDFGGKKAAWEATKSLGRGLTKIEGSEGLQELIQNASSKGLEDYYYDLYHGKKGFTGKIDAVLSSMQNPLTDMEGAKTFLMGALTGALISPGTKIISKVNEGISDRQAKKKDPNYQSRKEQVAENLSLINAMYDDPTQFKKEWLASVKVNNKAAETMEEAAKNHNKYVFYNAKDSAFAKTVSAAIKLNMFESMRDTIKEMGSNMSDEEFKKAFNVDPTVKNKGDVKSFMNTIADSVEDYYKTFTTLKDKFGDKVLPELYKYNKPEEYAQAKVAQAALNDAIEILSTNTYKAKQTIKRASELQTQIGSNANIGSSSIEVLTKMGSEQAIEQHIKILEKEIADSQPEGVTLTPEAREILKDKKEELNLAKKWQSSHAEVVNNTDESYSPTAEKRAYESFSELVNLFNKRSKNTTTVSKQDIDDNFINIIDYIRLNKDNKSYVDAINLLSDPFNLKLITDSMIKAHLDVNEMFKDEHKEEVKQITATDDEVFTDDVEQINKKQTQKATSEKTDLETYLQKEYNSYKTAAEAQNLPVATYENWRKTAGVVLEKRFLQNKQQSKQEENRVLINDKSARVVNTTVEGDNVYLDYEEDDGTKGRIIINKKTNKVTDEQGNSVKLSKPTEEKPTETSDIERKPVVGETLTSDSNQNYKVRGFTDKGGIQWENTKDGSKGVWNKEKFDEYVKDGRLKYDIAAPVLSDKKADIERRRQEELKTITAGSATMVKFVADGNNRELTEEEKNTAEELIQAFIENGEKDVDKVIKYLTSQGFVRSAYTGIEGQRAYIKARLEGIVTTPVNGRVVDDINSKYDAELAALEGKPEEEPEETTESEIEPELEKGDYRRAYALGRAMAQGKNINTIDNFDLIANYPNLIEAAAKIEGDRIAELDGATKAQANSINEKYDQQAKDLIARGKSLPEDTDETGNDIPDTSQVLDRKKLAEMKNDSEYGNRDYQVGWRQLAPSNSLANTTDIVKVNVTAGTVQYSRDKVNLNYVFDVATPNVNVGKALIYKVITDDEYYSNLEANRLTGTKYTKADLFDENGKVKENRFDEVPIGVYAEINGKETLIGTLHEPLWIEYEINGKHPHIATPEGIDEKTHVQNEVKANKAFRKTVLDAFNENPNFVITGHISDKSIGILKMVETPGLLKERINPEIGKGGEENPHGFFAIVRNGRLETSINNEATNVQETNSFTEKINDLSGIPALMLPTPTGTFMPTFIDLPKVDKGQAEFIIESWKAFTGKTENEELIDAVYNSLNRKRSEGTPDIGVLRDYISQYITSLENDKLDRIGNGSEAKPGDARLNIFNDGNLGIEVKDIKTEEWFNNEGKPIRTEADLPENIIELLQNLKTTIKFENRRNSDLVGINSTKKINFLTMKDGKLVSKEMTYNEYIMEKAGTFVEKGTESKNKNGDWVYFANPVVKMEYSNLAEEDENFEKEEKETIPVADLFEDTPDEEDLFSQLERAAAANNMTEEQIKEESNKCTGNPFADA